MRPLGARAPDLVALQPVNVQPCRTREPTADVLMQLLPLVPLPCAQPVQVGQHYRRGMAATSNALPSGRGQSR